MDDLLKNWYEAKETIGKMEAKIKDYKIQAERMMKTDGKNQMENKDYYLEMKKMKRRSISKDDLPEELWKNYSRENEFNCYYIMKAEDKNKKRRSPPRRSPSTRSPSQHRSEISKKL